MVVRVQYPTLAPDQPEFGNTLRICRNVYPGLAGYSPVKAPVAISDALGEAFGGGASAISTTGTAYLFSGTPTKLRKYAAGAWDDLLTGLTANRWAFAQFGDYLIGVNGGPTQVVDLNAGTASALTDAPTATAIAIVGDFVVLAQADGNILQIQWSAFNDHTGWTPDVDQSGYQPMLTGGEVMGVAGGEYGIILQRFRIMRMDRTGDTDAPFNFAEVTPNWGCASKASIVQAGRTVFFLSDRGFVALEDGQAPKPLGNERVDASFAATLSKDDYESLQTAVDPKRTIVAWGVPGAPGTIWLYNWATDRWATIEIPFSGLFSGYSSSLTLEQVSALYPDLDTMPYSLDDPRFQGGDPQLFVVDRDGKLCVLTGDALEAVFELGFGEFTKGMTTRFLSVRPITDATDGMTLSIDCRARLGDAEAKHISNTVRPSGLMPIRCQGRYAKIRVTHAAGSDWTYAQGIDLEIVTGGER